MAGTPTGLAKRFTQRVEGHILARRGKRVNIGIWGVPGGGKTTFLTALVRAAIDPEPLFANWEIEGDDAESQDFLEERREKLALGEFPIATMGIDQLRFKLVRRKRGFSVRPGRAAVSDRVAGAYVVSIPDPAGTLFASSGGPDGAKLVSTISESDGIVYLFDPIREFGAAAGAPGAEPNYQFFHGFLHRLLREADGARRLPHYLAVCITKFDDSKVYDSAVHRGWVSQDQHAPHRPRVPNSLAHQYFAHMCSEMNIDPSTWVVNLIRKHFHGRRVKYFVTSSVGFRRAGKSFLANHTGEPVRPQNPVNVFEPVVQLANKISTGRWIKDV